MKILLSCLSTLVLVLPAAAQGERPERRPSKEARTDKPAPPPAEEQREREAPRPGERRGPNEERDPERRHRFESRRASAVEARHLGRTLADLGRRTKSPLWLLTAAQMLQRVPPGRPLGQPAWADDGRNLLQLPPRQTEPTPILQAGGLLAEARLLARTQGGELQRQELALIDAIEASEVVTRGAALGPQSTCEGIGAQSKLTYHVAYEGGERAALGVSGAGPGDLLISISDEEGNLVSRTFDRSLVSWYPRWRAVFRIDIENRSPHRVEFCLETN